MDCHCYFNAQQSENKVLKFFIFVTIEAAIFQHVTKAQTIDHRQMIIINSSQLTIVTLNLSSLLLISPANLPNRENHCFINANRSVFSLAAHVHSPRFLNSLSRKLGSKSRGSSHVCVCVRLF